MILSIVGQQGSGKSLLAIFLSRKIQELSGAHIYTNMSVHNTDLITTITDLGDMPTCRSPKVLIIDEAMFSIDSRNSSSKSNLVWSRATAFFRKINCIVFLCTHTPDMVDVRLRNQMTLIVFSRRNKEKFDYLFIDMITQRQQPFSIPKSQELYDYCNFDTYDFPDIITVEKLAKSHRMFQVQR